MTELLLPTPDGQLQSYSTGPAGDFSVQNKKPFNRVAFAAAHVVSDPLKEIDPWIEGAAIDWQATLDYRRHLWRCGFGVAEAMDTAQRGGGMNWPQSLELIERTVEAARDFPGAVVASGAGTDHLEPGPHTIDQIVAAYALQCAAIQKPDGRIILMASRALAASAGSPDDFVQVYTRVLSDVTRPVILHWLGPMFDPALAGYWGHKDIDEAMKTCLEVIHENADKIDGIKISLLDKDREIFMRRQLPNGVRMYSGDDFNYAELIEGDNKGYSDALLGIFDAIAPAASAALDALAGGDAVRFNEILAPTVPLSRQIFASPTRFYKTGVVFMAYLNGMQSHFTMVGGQQSARSITHLAELFRLADKAGLLCDPELACHRMKTVLCLHGLSDA